jgi:hypothetical protein
VRKSLHIFGDEGLFAIRCTIVEPISRAIYGSAAFVIGQYVVGDEEEIDSLLIPAEIFNTKVLTKELNIDLFSTLDSICAYQKVLTRCIAAYSSSAMDATEAEVWKTKDLRSYLLFPNSGSFFDFLYGVYIPRQNEITFVWGHDLIPTGEITLSQQEFLNPIREFCDFVNSMRE